MSKRLEVSPLRLACKGEISPVPLAERILESPEEWSLVEVWLASNYLNAMTCIKLDRSIERFEQALASKEGEDE